MLIANFNQNFDRRRIVEQMAIDGLKSNASSNTATLECKTYTGDIAILSCKVIVTEKGLRSNFRLNGQRIAAHKIALRLGELSTLV